MLFTYSTRSLAENWLNQTVIQILTFGMQEIINGRTAPPWPGIIPTERKLQLKARSGIGKRIRFFWEQFTLLDRPKQEALLEALGQQTRLPDILFDDATCTRIDRFPDDIQEATIGLFRFLFEEQLISIKVSDKCLRDIHYTVIHTDIPSRICPFCGLGYFRAPGAPRHALDHYMPITKYPFIGSDFRNLPPMCSECNSDFKKSTDILYDGNGIRLRCVDPYKGPTFKISLANSLPFEGPVRDGIQLPLWKIEFIGGPNEQAENWDRIFKIRERYSRDVLNTEFRSWLAHFVSWFLGSRDGEKSGEEIVVSIPDYIANVIQDGFSERAFLKAEVFRLFYSKCLTPEYAEEMKYFFEDLITYA